MRFTRNGFDSSRIRRRNLEAIRKNNAMVYIVFGYSVHGTSYCLGKGLTLAEAFELKDKENPSADWDYVLVKEQSSLAVVNREGKGDFSDPMLRDRVR
jgi:hypothetical protein